MRLLFAVVGALVLVASLAIGLFAFFDQPTAVIKMPKDNQVEFFGIGADEGHCEAETQIKLLLSSPQTCQKNEDCLVQHYGCPFGCRSYVSQETHAQVQPLKTLFEAQCGNSCVYRCGAPPEPMMPACIEGLCTSAPIPDYNQLLEETKEKLREG